MSATHMFQGAIHFNSDISRWDVSNVTDMRCMFMKAYDFNADLSSWNVGNVRLMTNMFSVSGFVGDISHWDLRNLQDH
jgi:surface protein